MSWLLNKVLWGEENTSGCGYLSWFQQLDLYFFLLMIRLLLDVKYLKLLYHNQQKPVRIPECLFHALKLTIRDGLIHANLVFPLVYSRR